MSGFGFSNDPNSLGGSYGGSSEDQGGGASSGKNSGETSEETKKSFTEIVKEKSEEGPITEVIKQMIADGEYTIDGGALSLGGSLAEQFGKQLERFQNKHELIAFSGIMFQESYGESYSFTENLAYDPIRSSIGSIWTKDAGDIVRFANSFSLLSSGAAEKFNNLQNKTDKQIQELVGQDGIPVGYKYIPKVKFKFKKRMNDWGATHMMLGPSLTPSEEDTTAIRCKVFDIGKVQYLYLYFDLNGYPEAFKPVVPFNMFFDTKQKLEGYAYKSSIDPTKTKILKFNAFSGGNATKYDASFIKKDLNSTVLSDLSEGSDTVNGALFINQGGIVGSLEAKLYVDEVFSSQAAISEEAVPFFGSENLQGELVSDIKPEYNFFSPLWEYASKGLTEKLVGNIYEAAMQKNKFDFLPLQFDFEKFAKSFIVCDNTPEEFSQTPQVKKTNNVIISQDSEILDTVEDLKEQFPMYNEITFSQVPQGKLGNLFRKSGLTIEFLKSLLTWVYNDYDAPQEEKAANLAKVLAFSLIQPPILKSQNATIISKLKEPSSIDLFTSSQKTIQNQDDMITFDFLTWLEHYINEINGTTSLEEFQLYSADVFNSYTAYYGSDKFEKQFSKKSGLSFKKVIGLVKFISSAKNLMKNNFRSYHDILSGEEALSDILYYRIEKRSQKTGDVIQNFFVMPQEPDPDKGFDPQLRVIDTQVRYAQAYTYQVYAVKAVLGTEYKILTAPTSEQLSIFEANVQIDTTTNYEQVINPPLTLLEGAEEGRQVNIYPLLSPAADGTNNSEGKYVMPVKVSLRPTLKICEVPLYKERDVLIVDKPPMPPLVNIYPLNGQKNKILMTLETQTGDRELTPIPIEVNDSAYFVTERFSQKRDIVYPNGGYVYPTLRFKSDDDSSSYQIYRIEEIMPQGYGSFRDKLHKTLDKLAPLPEAGFEDTIKVNTKYYYTFRSLDMHGNVSNPSPIYEVEMVQASEGVFYPIIKVLDIDEIEKSLAEDRESALTSTTRTLKKTSYIFPAEQQILLNEEASGIDGSTANVPSNDPVLGIAAETIWGKKFKFRFISRHTGRAIDVNVDFNREHTKPQDALEPCFDVGEE